MPGPLRNTRHEAFCQALLEGKSATTAYEEAGYAKDDGNAAGLAKNPAVIERLTELQNAVAEKTQVTVESLVNELEEARKRADSLDQLSAVVKAISEKARISGLMVQKVESAALAISANVTQSKQSLTNSSGTTSISFTRPQKQTARALSRFTRATCRSGRVRRQHPRPPCRWC